MIPGLDLDTAIKLGKMVGKGRRKAKKKKARAKAEERAAVASDIKAEAEGNLQIIESEKTRREYMPGSEPSTLMPQINKLNELMNQMALLKQMEADDDQEEEEEQDAEIIPIH